MLNTANKNIVLVMGKPTTGKSFSLYGLRDRDDIAYLNTDLKELPFRSKMQEIAVTNPVHVLDFVQQIEQTDSITGGVLDTVSFLMEQFETQYIAGAADGRKAWGEYAQFYRRFIHAIKAGTKPYAILAHEKDVLNEKEMVMEQAVPVKGAVGKLGVEADFTTILGTRKISISEAEKWQNDLLTVTEDDEERGYCYVFQTRTTKDCIGAKYRAPVDLFSKQELYINNDLDLVFKRLADYYS